MAILGAVGGEAGCDRVAAITRLHKRSFVSDIASLK